jgi:hypothetical protein
VGHVLLLDPCTLWQPKRTQNDLLCLLYSIINYGIIFWGNFTGNKKVFLAQKKIEL